MGSIVPGQTSYFRRDEKIDPNNSIRPSRQTSNLYRRNEFLTTKKKWDRSCNINMLTYNYTFYFDSWKERRLTPRRASDVLTSATDGKIGLWSVQLQSDELNWVKRRSYHAAWFAQFSSSRLKYDVLPGSKPFHSWEWSMSKFPCSLTRNMTSHSMENLTFHSLLRWKVIILQILATSLIQSLFERLEEYTFWAQEWKG